jgi:predicted nucleotidyltransferase
MYAVPTAALHVLSAVQASVVQKEPSDHTFHEAAKFCRLSLNGNPTVMELLWLPSDLYEVRTVLGNALIDIRHVFLVCAAGAGCVPGVCPAAV